MPKKSETSHAILDIESRHQKAAKIIEVAAKFTNLSQASVLDIGTGVGVIAADIAKRAKSVTSVDMTDERKITDGYTFVQVSDETLPFEDKSFDVVVYNHVIEHVPDQQKHLDEIARVLKPGGIVYLATPNKYGPMDPHYRLPLVSWLPRPLASLYVRAARGKKWDIYPVSPWRIRKLTSGKFEDHNLTAEIIKRPTEYSMPTRKAFKLVGWLPLLVLRLLQPFAPTQIHILKRT
jgi:SAM-dependent methyltransferase